MCEYVYEFFFFPAIKPHITPFPTARLSRPTPPATARRLVSRRRYSRLPHRENTDPAVVQRSRRMCSREGLRNSVSAR